jgi:hypothetical protein
MESNRFDALTRRFAVQRSRRSALQGLAGGLLGVGTAKRTVAQVSSERATCNQGCLDSSDCNAGLRCSNDHCIAILDTRQQCLVSRDCTRDFEICVTNRCVNQVNCRECNEDSDCPSGSRCKDLICTETDSCNRDQDCGADELCCRGRCRVSDQHCRENADCRRGERCRRRCCK